MHQAAELGFTGAFYNLGMTYSYGVNIVERDEKKAMHYSELAAIQAMHYLGIAEGRAGNHRKALKRFMIAVVGRNNESLIYIRKMFVNWGIATKDDYTKALRAYQERYTT